MADDDDPDFASAAALAGYFVAHSLWSVSDGAAVMPVVAHEGPEGRGFQKFASEEVGGAARRAEEWLATNPSNAIHAVMVVDGFADFDGVRCDALIAHVIQYGPPRRSMHIVVPYRPKDSLQGFAVHSPRFGAAEGIQFEQLDALGDAFFSGVVSHTAASPIWTSHLDESV
jgi:hypothetical protein